MNLTKKVSIDAKCVFQDLKGYQIIINHRDQISYQIHQWSNMTTHQTDELSNSSVKPLHGSNISLFDIPIIDATFLLHEWTNLTI